jgi:Uma2 family endonuclease
MAAQPQALLTPEQYLELERAAETRHEYYNGEVFAMAGGSLRHAVVSQNFARELGNALKQRPCLVMSSDVRIRVAVDGLYTYPDVVVVCDPPKFVDNRSDTLLNPTLLVEVLSPSTEAHDRGFKFAQYRTIEGLQEYVLVSQAEARVEVFRRQEDGNWLMSEAIGLDAICELRSVDCRIGLDEIYAKVEFDANTSASLS